MEESSSNRTHAAIFATKKATVIVPRPLFTFVLSGIFLAALPSILRRIKI